MILDTLGYLEVGMKASFGNGTRWVESLEEFEAACVSEGILEIPDEPQDTKDTGYEDEDEYEDDDDDDGQDEGDASALERICRLRNEYLLKCLDESTTLSRRIRTNLDAMERKMHALEGAPWQDKNTVA